MSAKNRSPDVACGIREQRPHALDHIAFHLGYDFCLGWAERSEAQRLKVICHPYVRVIIAVGVGLHASAQPTELRFIQATISGINIKGIVRRQCTLGRNDNVQPGEIRTMARNRSSIGEFFESGIIENGSKIKLEIVVHKPEGSGPFPVVIFNHGSTGSGKNKSYRGKTIEYPSISRYFNDRGWMVVFPQRRGRGKSEGIYDEGFELDRSKYSCDPALSLPGVDRALEDLGAVTTYLTGRADVVANRMVIAGASRGGILAIACAGQSKARFVGAINFSGGWLGRACSTYEVVNRVTFLRGASFPGLTIWLHGTKDGYYNIAQCRRNYQAFCEAGGKGTFVELPGRHGLLLATAMWGKYVDEYLSLIEAAPSVTKPPAQTPAVV